MSNYHVQYVPCWDILIGTTPFGPKILCFSWEGSVGVVKQCQHNLIEIQSKHACEFVNRPSQFKPSQNMHVNLSTGTRNKI